jgi:hypothetical protein
MFKDRKKYKAVKEELLTVKTQLKIAIVELNSLRKRWNDLVTLINEKGGDEFLQHGTIDRVNNNLTRQEIMFIIKNVHPDKHINTQQFDIANSVTKKLIDQI